MRAAGAHEPLHVDRLTGCPCEVVKTRRATLAVWVTRVGAVLDLDPLLDGQQRGVLIPALSASPPPRGTEGATCTDTTNVCCDSAYTPVSTRGSVNETVHDYLRPLTDAPSPPSVTATGVPPVRRPAVLLSYPGSLVPRP